MIVGIKDAAKLFAITIVICCAAFVCNLFLNYNADIVGIKDEITTAQALVVYDAQVATGKVVSAVSGGCLVLTTVVMLIFYVKLYIDSHQKELGILKSLGYSNLKVSIHFGIFGLSVLLGSLLGFAGATAYMPTFYKVQNREGFLPEILPKFHPEITICLLILPALFFMLLAIFYAFIKLKSPVIGLLKEIQTAKSKKVKTSAKDLPFLRELKSITLKSHKILVFFIGFSAFCFSSMTQMSMSMKALSSETFAWMIISIGLVLAFTTLLMSLTSVIKANTKTIAMMKVFGYSEKECARSILGGYRPAAYVGFVIGTLYQYGLLRIMVDVVFADYENMPTYNFDFKALAISLVVFIVAYEIITFVYSRKIGKQSIKSVMLS